MQLMTCGKNNYQIAEWLCQRTKVIPMLYERDVDGLRLFDLTEGILLLVYLRHQILNL